MPKGSSTPRAGRPTPATPPRAPRGGRIPRAYTELRELIIWGSLAPGSRIVESDVAADLALSRTPVRSALHRLQQEGYIATAGGTREQRLIIAPLTQEDARELFAIVGAIEGLAARVAASAGASARRLLAAELRELNRRLAEVARARRPDPLRLFELDTSFHRRYVEAGAGPRLLALHDAIKPQAERYIRLYINALVNEIALSVAEHEIIVQRIAQGRGSGAQGAVERNWRNAAARLSHVIAASAITRPRSARFGSTPSARTVAAGPAARAPRAGGGAG